MLKAKLAATGRQRMRGRQSLQTPVPRLDGHIDVDVRGSRRQFLTSLGALALTSALPTLVPRTSHAATTLISEAFEGNKTVATSVDSLTGFDNAGGPGVGVWADANWSVKPTITNT